MTEITQEQVESLQKEWKRYTTETSTIVKPRSGFATLLTIDDMLKEMGLDMSQNETYELVDPSLDAELFREHCLTASMKEMVAHYGKGVIGQDGEWSEINADLSNYLEDLINKWIPFVEKYYDGQGAQPRFISELTWAAAIHVLELNDQKILQVEMENRSVLAAQDYHRNAVKAWEDHESNMQHDSFRYDTVRQGLSYVNGALEFIERADAMFSPVSQTPKARHRMKGYPDPESGMMEHSISELEKLQKKFLVAELIRKFETSADFQKQGHFVLDQSGSGHGSMVMPMQNIAKRLQEFGFDLSRPETFEIIGTDIDTFRAAYATERAEVAKDDKYNLLKKPAFKI